MRPSRLSILLVLAGCGDGASAVATGDAVPRSVDPDAPAADATNVDNGNDISPIGLHWYSPGAWELSTATDLAAAASFVATTNHAWKGPATSKPHTVSPAFPDVLDAAAATAADRVQDANAGEIDDAIDALDEALPMLTFGDGSASSRWAGFAPLHARWLTQDIALPPNAQEGQPETVTDHPAPSMFDDSRLRGARLYCSARRAREEQGDGSPTMGRQSALEISLFGFPVRFLTIEPRVQLSNPTRIALEEDQIDVDGAQAFTIPMLLGTTFELTSLLPSLPELRTPAVLITADTEVETKAKRRPIAIGGTECTFGRGGYTCGPNTEMGYAKTYQTATHVDAVAVGSYARATTDDGVYLPLGRVGPMEIWLDGLASIRLGQTSWAQWSAANGPNIPVGIVDDRVLGDTFKPPGATTRSGQLHLNTEGYVFYHDAPWDLFTTDAAVVDYEWALGTSNPWKIRWFGSNPAVEYVRPLQNDDHAFAIGNEFHVEVNANVGLVSDFSLGPFSLSGPEIEGGLAGTLRQSFEFRDALHAQSWEGSGNPALAATGLTVQPRTAGLASTTPIKVKMSLSLDLWFDEIEIEFSHTLVPSANLADFDSADDGAWGEESRLRIGTGGVTDFGHYTTRDSPLVASHLSGRPDHVPFADQDVASCLAEPPLDLPDPEVCESPEGDPTLPSAEVCLVMNPTSNGNDFVLPPLPSNACSSISQYAAAEEAPIRDCLQSLLSFVCEPVSQVQSTNGSWEVARVIEWDEAFFTSLEENLMLCSAAWSELGQEYAEQDLVDTLVRMEICDANANILEDDEIFSTGVNPFASPPVSGPNECP